MCVLFVAWRVRPDVPLVVAANRDEFHDRPAAPAAPWGDCPGVYAGRDLRAGGTWMGANVAGRWAAVTNVRRPEWIGRTLPRSRGALVADYLCGASSAEAYAHAVLAVRSEVAGFNLLVGDAHALYYVRHDVAQVRSLDPGYYGLSNGTLDEPWPKVARGSEAFRRWVEGDLDPEAGLALLRDREEAPEALLPDTGVGVDLERRLSPLFIVLEGYGTRSSTLLIARADGHGELVERTFGPDGEPNGTTRLVFPFSSAPT